MARRPGGSTIMLRASRRKSRDRRLQRRSVYLLPVLLDEELPFAGGCGASVLTLPLGAQTVLARLFAELSGCRHRTALIVSQGDPSVYERCLPPAERSGYRVVRPSDLSEVLASCETSDYLVIVQARFWPLSGHDFHTLARHSAKFRGATHAVAVGRLACGARERLDCDGDGRVRRVRRLYDHMSWPEASASRITCTLAPAHALGDLDVSSPARLRAELAARGVLTHDVPIASDIADLTQPSGILTLNERMVEQTLATPPEEGYSLRGDKVLAGTDCHIHPSARIVGPVLIHHGVVIEEGAQIIGPAVLGEGARISKDAVVARSVLGPAATVPAGATTGQQVVVGAGHMSKHDSAAEETSNGTGARSFVLRGGGLEQPLDWTPTDLDGRPAAELALKRVIDIVGSFAGLLLLSPLLVLVGALVKLTSRGPMFFVHRREGKDGAEFPCIKFRSMVADAHLKQREMYNKNQLDGPQFKLEHDPRETPLGRWLRRLNIDELPQLLNVLMGQMSLVGPRPSPFRENQICVAWRRARLSVRPGITGLWQVCRDRRSDGDFHQWVYYDLAYVRHFSLWLDVKILIYTFLTLGGRYNVSLSRLIRMNHGHEAGATSQA